MIARRLSVYMLVDHGVTYRGRRLASWQEVGKVDEGARGANLEPWRTESPLERFEAGDRTPALPYGYTRPPVSHGSKTSYRSWTDDA